MLYKYTWWLTLVFSRACQLATVGSSLRRRPTMFRPHQPGENTPEASNSVRCTSYFDAISLQWQYQLHLRGATTFALFNLLSTSCHFRSLKCACTTWALASFISIRMIAGNGAHVSKESLSSKYHFALSDRSLSQAEVEPEP